MMINERLKRLESNYRLYEINYLDSIFDKVRHDKMFALYVCKLLLTNLKDFLWVLENFDPDDVLSMDEFDQLETDEFYRYYCTVLQPLEIEYIRAIKG